jgi:hypothetical protein
MTTLSLAANASAAQSTEPVQPVEPSHAISTEKVIPAQDANIQKIASSDRIDRTFTATGDVTSDGSVERLTVHVTGESITAPFRWSFVITNSDGAVIYKVERDDAKVDRIFKDDYGAGCSGYTACKKQYYFKDVPTTIFDSLKPTDPHESRNPALLSSLKKAATAFLDAKGIPAEKREAAIEEMKRTLTKPGFRALDVPSSPLEWDSPMIWVKGVQMFVPYSQD